MRKTADTIGGTAENDTGAGPPHWYENYNAKNSRAWMISDPPDGKMPALTEEAKKRAAACAPRDAAATATTSARSTSRQDLSLYVRCITRGLPGSMMPAIYGNSYDITQGPVRCDSLRDGARDARHPARPASASRQRR